MIIEIEQDKTILNAKADALVMVVDQSGRDVTGLLKHWLDIAQVIEMMALCKELVPGKALHFELERAHLYVITNSDVERSMKSVFEMARSHDVESINVPNIEDVGHAIWGMEVDDDILVRLCRH